MARFFDDKSILDIRPRRQNDEGVTATERKSGRDVTRSWGRRCGEGVCAERIRSAGEVLKIKNRKQSYVINGGACVCVCVFATPRWSRTKKKKNKKCTQQGPVDEGRGARVRVRVSCRVRPKGRRPPRGVFGHLRRGENRED